MIQGKPEATKKQVIGDWQKLFPDFKKVRINRKFLSFFMRCGPVIKVVGMYFDPRGGRYGVSIRIGSMINGLCQISSVDNDFERHYIDVVRNQKRYTYYLYDYKCLIDRAREYGIDFYQPLSVTQIFNLYKANGPYLETDSADDPALIAAWAGMDDLAKEAADWAEEYYSEDVKKLEDPLNLELLALWKSLSSSERKNPHWADDLLKHRNSSHYAPPLILAGDPDGDTILFRTPNGSAMFISLDSRSPMEQITRKKYASVKEWREKLNARLADREGLQRLVEENIKKRGLENIPRQELILE
jgi:hypothetical protein